VKTTQPFEIGKERLANEIQGEVMPRAVISSPWTVNDILEAISPIWPNV
jgi:hypothetical protein